MLAFFLIIAIDLLICCPGHDGKAGMVSISLIQEAHLGNRELDDLYHQVMKELPFYARPLFVRHLPEAVITGTFKNKKVELAQDGFDPDKVKDPVYFLDHKTKTYSLLTKRNCDRFIKSKL